MCIRDRASRVYLPRMAIHKATGEASRVYNISLTKIVFRMKCENGLGPRHLPMKHRASSCRIIPFVNDWLNVAEL